MSDYSQYGYRVYKTVIVLGVGVRWIKNIFKDIFPEAIIILDLCENIYEYAKAIFKNDETKYKSWTENVIDNFMTVQKEKAIEEIQIFVDIKTPRGTVNFPNYVKILLIELIMLSI